MSIYYSRFALNTCAGSEYFQAHLPKNYPLYPILRKSRAFRRLPPTLRELAANAARWEALQHPEHARGTPGIEDWYNLNGEEVDPDTGRPLTDAEIDAQWGGKPDPDLADVEVKDVPRPKGGFPDPTSWKPPRKVDDAPEADAPSRKQLIHDVAVRGIEATAETWGVPEEQLKPLEKEAMVLRKSWKTKPAEGEWRVINDPGQP